MPKRPKGLGFSKTLWPFLLMLKNARNWHNSNYNVLLYTLEIATKFLGDTDKISFQTDLSIFHFYSRIIFHYTDIPPINTHNLFHGNTFSISLVYIPRKITGSSGKSMVTIFKNNFTFLPAVSEKSNFSPSLPTFIIIHIYFNHKYPAGYCQSH